MKVYVLVEKGIYYDGFLEIPLKPIDGSPENPTWRGYAYIEGDRMRIAPDGGWSIHLYDYEIGKPTPESVENHKQWYAGYEYGKKQQRRRWPNPDQVMHTYFKDGYMKAWEEKGKPFDQAYWNQYWSNRK